MQICAGLNSIRILYYTPINIHAPLIFEMDIGLIYNLVYPPIMPRLLAIATGVYKLLFIMAGSQTFDSEKCLLRYVLDRRKPFFKLFFNYVFNLGSSRKNFQQFIDVFIRQHDGIVS